MRVFQIILFFVALLDLISALIFAGSVMGDILWRVGIAILLIDVVCIMLWPEKTKA
jgi:hypothetical protein